MKLNTMKGQNIRVKKRCKSVEVKKLKRKEKKIKIERVKNYGEKEHEFYMLYSYRAGFCSSQ